MNTKELRKKFDDAHAAIEHVRKSLDLFAQVDIAERTAKARTAEAEKRQREADAAITSAERAIEANLTDVESRAIAAEQEHSRRVAELDDRRDKRAAEIRTEIAREEKALEAARQDVAAMNTERRGVQREIERLRAEVGRLTGIIKAAE